MNITELARILKVNPQELRDLLPQMGFNIGQRAIKVDNFTTRRIIKEWPVLLKQIKLKKEAEKNKVNDTALDIPVEKKKVAIPNFISIRDFAALATLPINKVISELMKNGIFASMNERIDFDTASIIGEELNLEVSLIENSEDESKSSENDKIEKALSDEKPENLENRFPVIVVMGHVDHGKTRLLDAIRKTNVIAGEAGGITQHIGAYQVTRKDKKMTFIDTPGHEAFTAMRSRGAKVADIAILVVAADDGVKPQTVEAFRIIEAAKIPYIVAINKIDKLDSDVNRTKQELSTMLKITPEDWGGKTICVPISAKDEKGIDELLDMVLLLAETEADNLKANPKADAIGTIIEARLDKGAGPIATILIQNGTLRVGDQLCFNNVFYGKVKALYSYKGEVVDSAGPSEPARILGLKMLPEVGDVLSVGEGEKIKVKKVSNLFMSNKPAAKAEENDDNILKLNLIIKSDVLGSIEAIEESLLKINSNKIKVKIINKSLGMVGEGDVKRAEDSGAQIVCFNVKVQPQTENLIREKNVKVKMFSVIYDLIKYVKAEMQAMIVPEYVRKDLGRLKVLAIFRTETGAQIIGGKVLDGVIENNSFIEVIRDKEIVEKGKLVKLQSGKQDVNMVEKDQECGLKYEGKPVVVEGDILNIYKEEEVINKI
ncbi:MAG: translation initiation factor IF-2 [Candidatus Falkowbacteria bacterium]